MATLLADIFSSDAFRAISLTRWVNQRDFKPDTVTRLGIYREEGLMGTDRVQIDRSTDGLGLVAITERGAAGPTLGELGRTTHDFKCQHIEQNARIYVDSTLNVRESGEAAVRVFERIVQRRLERMRRNIESTLEWFKVAGLRGRMIDADGTTVKVNVYTGFNIAEPAAIDYDLDNATPASGAVTKKINSTIRAIQDAVGDLVIGGYHALCSSAFFDDLVAHPEVQDSFRFENTAQWLREERARRAFMWRGVLWEEYSRSVGGVAMVPADQAVFFPVDTPDLFDAYYAPPDSSDVLGTGEPAPPIWVADPYVDPRRGAWVDLHMQSNPLMVCLRPQALRLLTRT